MSIAGYQSNVPKVHGGELIANNQRELSVPSNQLNEDMLHSPGRNIYAVINENIVIGKDIRLRSRSRRKKIAGWQLSLPAPINKNQKGEHTGTLLSRQGKPFYYAIDDDGRVFVSGVFDDPEDEIIFNINPYVAELPLKFRPFSDGIFALPPDVIERDEVEVSKPEILTRAQVPNRLKKNNDAFAKSSVQDSQLIGERSGKA